MSDTFPFSDTAMWRKLCSTTGLSWSSTSIIGLSPSWKTNKTIIYIFMKWHICCCQTSGFSFLKATGLTSFCPIERLRRRTSFRMLTPSLRVTTCKEQSSNKARPSTACITKEWLLRSASALELDPASKSCQTEKRRTHCLEGLDLRGQ